MQNDNIIKDPNELLEKIDNLHPSDIAYSLRKIENESIEDFFYILKTIPDELLGEVLLELPDNLRDSAYEELSIQRLTDAVDLLESDDATDIIQEIEEIDKQKAKDIYEGLEEEDKKDIEWLKRYEEDEAGAYMQTELFSAKLSETIGESINRLKNAKANDELVNIHQVFVVNDEKSLIASVSLEDLIIFDFDKTYEDILNEADEYKYRPFKVSDNTHIDEVAKHFEQYDLNVVAVVGYQDMLMGRITSDDILDVIEQNATEQMYQLAGVHEDFEHEDNLITTAKKEQFGYF